MLERAVGTDDLMFSPSLVMHSARARWAGTQCPGERADAQVRFALGRRAKHESGGRARRPGAARKAPGAAARLVNTAVSIKYVQEHPEWSVRVVG